jgi:hypothetical protein
MRMERATVLFILVMAGVAVLRLFYTTRMMVITGDIIRNLFYGVLVDQIGFSVATRPLAFYSDLQWVPWSTSPYIYPILSLAFFKLLAAWPTIFFARLVLTLIEGVNTWLVYRFTRQRWLAALYWASPVSIWWVSREGQFEPLQNLFALGALCLLGRCAPLAFLLLTLAIQVKLTAVFLLPFFLITAWRMHQENFFGCMLGMLGGCLPTLLALRAYPVLNTVAGNLANMVFTPYYWNPFNGLLRGWVTPWHAAANQAATYGVLIILAWKVARSARRWEYLAPMLFLMALKSHTNVQPWYFLVWPTFLLPISDRRMRLALFALMPLMDISSTLALCHVYLGPVVPAFFKMISVFEPLLR